MKRLRELRLERGMTLEELGRMLGVSHCAVISWESGRAWPKTENLIKLARIFEVTIDELISDSERAG